VRITMVAIAHCSSSLPEHKHDIKLRFANWAASTLGTGSPVSIADTAVRWRGREQAMRVELDSYKTLVHTATAVPPPSYVNGHPGPPHVRTQPQHHNWVDFRAGFEYCQASNRKQLVAV